MHEDTHPLLYPMLCERLVPQPSDVSPIRSPMAVHTVLAKRFAGKDLVEIGTRNGDGMSCWARHAKHATAIELDPKYCKALERRSRTLPQDARFNVSCADYRKAAMNLLDGDFVTWWEQPPLHNIEALDVLHAKLRAHRLRPTAEAVLLFDPKWPADRVSFSRICPLARWSQQIFFNEQEECLKRVREGAIVSKHRDAERRLCDRAKGFFQVVGVRISDRRIPELRNSTQSQSVRQCHL